jgi:hypothetical protein
MTPCGCARIRTSSSCISTCNRKGHQNSIKGRSSSTRAPFYCLAALHCAPPIRLDGDRTLPRRRRKGARGFSARWPASGPNARGRVAFPRRPRFPVGGLWVSCPLAPTRRHADTPIRRYAPTEIGRYQAPAERATILKHPGPVLSR